MQLGSAAEKIGSLFGEKKWKVWQACKPLSIVTLFKYPDPIRPYSPRRLLQLSFSDCNGCSDRALTRFAELASEASEHSLAFDRQASALIDNAELFSNVRALLSFIALRRTERITFHLSVDPLSFDLQHT